MKRAAIILAATLAFAQGAAAQLAPEKIEKLTLGDFTRVYVADPTLPHMVDGRIYVLDTDMQLKGMMESGFAGMMLAAPARRQVFVPSSFYERVTRGKRTDAIQIYDDRTLTVVDERPVSSARSQARTYRNLFQASSAGAVLFGQNATLPPPCHGWDVWPVTRS